MDTQPSLPKQELRKMEQEQLQRAGARKQLFRRVLHWAIGVAVLGLIVWGLYLIVQSQPRVTSDDILSRNGIHWHPHLTIRINGKEEIIPGGVGLSGIHNPIHTHDSDNIIHVEYERPGTIVVKDDVRLEKFFKVWNRRFTRECVFDFCNGPDGKVQFIVNGEKNDDFERYVMRDKDAIEIRYE